MPTILIVDDERAIGESLRDLLEDGGYSVHLAANGQAALEILAELRPDLVLLDVMMPVLDGIETLRRLRADERTRDLPVVLMTAAPALSPALTNEAELLHKPFDIDRLLAVVGRHVRP